MRYCNDNEYCNDNKYYKYYNTEEFVQGNSNS